MFKNEQTKHIIVFHFVFFLLRSTFWTRTTLIWVFVDTQIFFKAYKFSLESNYETMHGRDTRRYHQNQGNNNYNNYG